jgi:hypothetical protein
VKVSFQTSIGGDSPKRLTGTISRKMALVAAIALFLVLAFFAGHTPVHVRLVSSGSKAVLTLDGSTHTFIWPSPPRRVSLLPPDPYIHDWGIDGSESLTLNNLSPAYLQSISSNPYVAFDRWLRGEVGYDAWRNIRLIDAASGRTLAGIDARSLIRGLPIAGAFSFEADIYRLEQPVTVQFVAPSGVYQLHIDRNARSASIANNPTTGTPSVLAQWFFPTDPWPYLALNASTAIDAVVWAALLLALAVVLALLAPPSTLPRLRLKARWAGPGAKALAILALAASVALTLYITVGEYNGLPHVPDAQAYLWQAKIFASGSVSLPAPPLADSFLVPLFGLVNGRWVSQYAPGTALSLVPGVLLGLPWLVQPLLGVGTLILVLLIGLRLYNRLVATIAVVLGALSPLHSFLVGTYLSHTATVFFGTLAYYLLVLSEWGRRRRPTMLAGAAIGLTFLCRELSALLIALPLTAPLVLSAWRRGGTRAAVIATLAWAGAALPLIIAYGLYDWSITGNALLSPREVLNPTDRYGFGAVHGWWGQHTLAAGLVNLDQLLTGLNLDLFGWPFYMALAMPLVPFVAGRATRWDGLNAALALSVLVGTVGYFYNGVMYGPRYVYEALPALLLLAARGVQVLGDIAGDVLAALHRPRQAGRVAAHVILAACILPNLLFYLPRQIQMYRNFSATPWMPSLPIARLYEKAPRHAIVVTSDGWLYSRDLAALNTPAALANPAATRDTVWALASTPARYAQLRATFRGRRLYILTVDGTAVTYTPWR